MSTILLTGAGGGALPGLITSLRARGYRVIAADASAQAVGLLLADAGHVIPFGHTPEFLPKLREVCRSERVDVVLPLVDEELVPASFLEDDGIAVVLPRRPFVEMCLDKFVLMERMRAEGFDVPATRLASEGIGDLVFPLVAKPRSGRGSRGVAVLGTDEELAQHLHAVGLPADRMILQEHVEGTEFTVSVVVGRSGVTSAVVPKEIILKRGITQSAVTRRSAAIDSYCRRLQQVFSADGPFNVQLRVDAHTGSPRAFEINPRFSTTVSLTVAAGVDEPGELIAQFLGQPAPADLPWNEGVVLLRHMADTFLDELTYRKRINALSRM